MRDPTRRFSSRVENYIKYRPAYPREILDTLRAECQLDQASVIADAGSGTGLLSRLFLQYGNRVFGIEPNQEMREAGERLLRGFPKFTSVAARAEATQLPDHSVDFVTAGQAFHWFNLQQARKEFARILKPQGWVALVWNERRVHGSPFLEAYEQLLLKYGTDYETSRHREVDIGVIRTFFGAGSCKLKIFENRQIFDLGGLKGRLLSSSYTPETGQPNYAPMLEALEAIFNTYQVNGKIRFEYDTKLYYGRLVPDKT